MTWKNVTLVAGTQVEVIIDSFTDEGTSTLVSSIIYQVIRSLMLPPPLGRSPLAQVMTTLVSPRASKRAPRLPSQQLKGTVFNQIFYSQCLLTLFRSSVATTLV